MAKPDQQTAIATISNIFMEITIEFSILLRLNALFLNCSTGLSPPTNASELCGHRNMINRLKVQVFSTCGDSWQATTISICGFKKMTSSWSQCTDEKIQFCSLTLIAAKPRYRSQLCHHSVVKIPNPRWIESFLSRQSHRPSNLVTKTRRKFASAMKILPLPN